MHLLVVLCSGITTETTTNDFYIRLPNNARLIGVVRDPVENVVHIKVCCCENCEEEDIDVDEEVCNKNEPNARIGLVYGSVYNGQLLGYLHHNGKMEYLNMIHGEKNLIVVRMGKPDVFDRALTSAKIRECLSLN